MGALLLYESKITLVHSHIDAVAIAALKVWKVPKSEYFPEGIKYSMFLVEKLTGNVLLGYDNHKPKGHHMHTEDEEYAYDFKDIETLVNEFWSGVIERGYLV